MAGAGRPEGVGAVLGYSESAVTILSDGLQVVVEPSPDQDYVVVGYWLQVGSADDPADRGGLTHFSEHLISPHALAQRPGARLVAVETSLDYTGALFTVATEDLAPFLRAHAQRYHQRAWDSSAFELVRHGVLRELEFRDRHPIVCLQTQLLAQYFDGHPYARPVVGSRGCVQAIEAADIARLIEREYRCRPALLFVRGPCAPNEILDLVSDAHVIAGGTRVEAAPVRRTRAGRRSDVRLERSHSANAHVVLGLPAPPVADADYLLFLAALNQLFGVSAHGIPVETARAPNGWLERVTNIGETVERVDVSLSPTSDRFVALVGFQLRHGVDPAVFADRMLDAIAQFPRALTAMTRDPGDVLSESWNLANAASPSPAWSGAVHRLMGASASLRRLPDHRPCISPAAVARFAGSAWIPSDCPVGILTSQTSARVSIVCAPIAPAGDSTGDDVAPPERHRPGAAARGAELIEWRRAGALFRCVSMRARIAAASVTIPVAEPSAATHAVLTVFAASLQATLHRVLGLRGARFAQGVFSSAAVPAYDHLRLELSAAPEVFYPMLTDVVSVCRRELPGVPEFERAVSSALDSALHDDADEPLMLIRAARQLWFPPSHVLREVPPGPRAGLERLAYGDMHDFALRGFSWEESRVGIAGPHEARSSLESVSAAFESIAHHTGRARRTLHPAAVPAGASRTCVAQTPMTRGAVLLAVPSVSCQDSVYPTLAVANALLALRLRTRLQRDEPSVLYARSFLDATIVPGLWYVYLTTVSPDLAGMVEKIHDTIDAIASDGPDAFDVEAARRYLWDHLSRVESPLGRAALARSIVTEVDAPLPWGDFLRRAYGGVTPAQVRGAFQDRFGRTESIVVLARAPEAT